MRRKEKEITDKAQMEEIMAGTNVLRMAMVDDGEPYIVAMNFAYEGGHIYLHSAREGRKLDIIRKNNRVAFFIDFYSEPVESPVSCNYGMHYSSVFGTGSAILIDEPEEKIKGLDIIMKKHTGKTAFNYNPETVKKTLLIRLDIDRMTGKRS